VFGVEILIQGTSTTGLTYRGHKRVERVGLCLIMNAAGQDKDAGIQGDRAKARVLPKSMGRKGSYLNM